VPSKGGRQNGGVVRPLEQVVTPEALGADAASLSRPLRRGHEVDRFNELSRRRDQLTPAESDELYQYRLRRLAARDRSLEGVTGGWGEEEIRRALDDRTRRLTELRSFEEQRRAAGLPAGYAIDATAEERALDRLGELASGRPRGLIAGEGGEGQAGSEPVALPEAAFSPSPDDPALFVLAPASVQSDALARNVAQVAGQGANLHLVRTADEIPHDRPALVLNWGGNQPVRSDLVLLNRPEAVRVSSDQVESLRQLGNLAPRTVLNPQDVSLLGTDRVVGKRRQGARGAGKRVLVTNSPARELASFDLYQEFAAERREYRVSVLSGRVVSAYHRRPPARAAPEDLHPAWRFDRARQVPRAVAQVARAAAQRIGLDYAGVDVVEDLRSGRVMCLEANAAPGMSADTVRSLYANVQQILRGTRG
jgi:hypothetical protein